MKGRLFQRTRKSEVECEVKCEVEIEVSRGSERDSGRRAVGSAGPRCRATRRRKSPEGGHRRRKASRAKGGRARIFGEMSIRARP